MSLSDELVNELTPFIEGNGAILIMPYHKKIFFGMRHENEIMRLIKDAIFKIIEQENKDV